MAEQKKPSITEATANNVSEWIDAYYGDDAVDYSKKNKIKHIVRLTQYSSLCFMVSKNSKKAHVDFFESNYTTLDTYYAKAADIIIKLLNIKYGENRPLTVEDFKKCGGEAMFGDKADFATICDDYIGSGGMVEMAESAFPQPTGRDLRLEDENVYGFNKWLETASEDDKAERAFFKKRNLFKSFVADMGNVNSDYTQLLQIAGKSDKEVRDSGVLSGLHLRDIYRTATDKGSKMQRELKDKKSKLDFAVKDDLEKGPEYSWDLFKKTTKVGALGAVAVSSMGAVIGGVFWPALVLIPTFSLAKHWAPDWIKSMGAMWGHFEKSMKTRYERQKIDSYYNYMISFAETGGKPKIRLKDRLFLNKDIIKCLKKGAKAASVASTVETTDGKNVLRSEIDQAQEATSRVMGNLLNPKDGEGLVPTDKQTLLYEQLKAIKTETATIEQFRALASKYITWEKDMSGDKRDFQIAYAEKLGECAERLIFHTPLKGMTTFQDVIDVALKDDGLILSVIKDMPGLDTVQKIKRLRTYASKELTGLEAENWQGKTLHDYIYRDDLAVPGTPSGWLDAGDANLQDAILYIQNLKAHPKDEKTVIAEVPGVGVVNLEDIKAKISKIGKDKDKDKCNKYLLDAMKIVIYNAGRVDSRRTYQALTSGEFGGKMANIDDFFAKFKEIKYDSIGSMDFSKLIYDVTGDTKISPPEVGKYLRSKFGKAIYDEFRTYVTDERNAKFKETLSDVLEYLQKVGNSSYLTEWQKADLTQLVTPFIATAFGQDCINLISSFGEKYQQDKYTAYLNQGYAQGGMRDLFKSDQSAEVQDVKNRVIYLRSLQAEFNTMKLNGYTLNKDVERYIATSLIQNRDTGEFITKGTADPLRKFMEHVRTNMNGIFDSGLNSDNVVDSQPYQDLENALKEIQTKFTRGSYDKYTALLLLQSKAKANFTYCMNSFTSRSGDRRQWIGANMDPIKELASRWSAKKDGSKGILQLIDDAIADSEFDALQEKCSTNSACANILPYTRSVADIEVALGEKTM